MDILKIRIVDISDKGYAINEVISVSEIQPVDVEPLPIETIKVEGIIKKAGKNFLFHGKIMGCYQHACDRCLDDMEYELEKEIIWLFERGQISSCFNLLEEVSKEAGTKSKKGKEQFDELAEKRLFQGDEIDLTPYIWEELVLDMPYKFLCKEDCAGLCPKCGANRNHETCSCQIDSEKEDVEIKNTKLSELLQGINLNLKEE